MRGDVRRRLPRSLRWRLVTRRRPYRYSMPVISPYTERLKRAAFGDHVCRVFWVKM